MNPSVATIIARNEPYPSLSYMSDLTIYDEALINGRWIGRYWSGNGFLATARDIAWLEANTIKPAKTGGIDQHAFWLEVDGQALHFGWQMTGHSIAQKDDQCASAWVALKSTVRPITVKVHTETDDTGFFTRWLEITNLGDRPAALGAVYPLCGLLNLLSAGLSSHNLLPPRNDGKPAYTLGYYTESDWGNEGAFTWLPLPNTPVRIEGRLGKSGHGHPFFILRNELTGEHFVGGLEWSANWMFEFTSLRRPFERDITLVGFKGGPAGPGPLRVLAPGETVTSPKLHIGMMFADLDGCVQAWHRHLRRSVLPALTRERGLLVNYDHWSYMEHEMSEERLCHEIDVAAEVGAEIFTVDAGWYGDKGTDWWRTVGNWRAGDRLPNGLEPVFAYARKKGLGCGLWLDIERIGSESKIAHEHPEWFLSYYGQPSDEFNLTNPAAQAWMEAHLVRIIEQHHLDVFRLDYTTWPYEGGQTPRDGYMENTRWRYYEFIYNLYERLQQRFPNLIMENCAGGGGRTDLGMMRRFHYVQVTDWPIAPRGVRILNGMTLALPPERLLFWSGIGQAEHLRGDLDFHMRLSLLTHFGLTGIIPAASERNEALMARVKHHISLFKSFVRPMLADCRVYHHTPILSEMEPEGWCVLEYVSDDKAKAMIALFRLAGDAEARFCVHPRGLSLGCRYRITSDNRGESYEESGEALARQGLTIQLDRALGSELFLLEAV